MAKTSLGKLDTRQPVAVDLAKVHDLTARMNTPAAPPQMSADFITPINVPQPKAWRPNALAVLDGVLGGATFTESRRAEEDRHRAELAMPQMEALKTRLLTELGKAGPDELKAYLTNPGEFGKNIATRLAASDLAAGSSRVYGNPDQGGSVYTAPKTDTAAGQAFSYGPDGVKALGAVPFVPDYVNVSEGGKAVPKTPILPPGFGGASDPTAGLPRIGESRPAPVAAAGQPRSVRNNNPGNLEDGPFTRSQPGYKGSDGRFAIFESPDAGHAAQVALLGSYGKRGINTVEAIINRWAPPTENDTGGYVNFVAQKAGVKPGDPIDMSDPEILGRVADAIRIFEGGPQSKSNPAPASAPAAVRASGDPPGTIYGNEKAKPALARPATDAEKAAYGIPSDIPAQIKPDGSIDAISVGSGRGSGKLAATDSKYISEARTAAQQLTNALPLVNRFVALNEEVNTGGALGVGLVSGPASLFSPKIAEMKAITDRLTPAMRQGMPGAASDRDVAMFQSATVGLGKPGPANQSVAAAMKAATKRQQDYVAYLEDYARKNGSLLGAQEEWDAYAAANPMFNDQGSGVLKLNKTEPWRQYFGEAPTSRQDQAPKVEKGSLPPSIYSTRDRLKAAGRLDPTAPMGSERNPFVARDQSVVDQLEKRFPGQKIYVITPEGLGVLE